MVFSYIDKNGGQHYMDDPRDTRVWQPSWGGRTTRELLHMDDYDDLRKPKGWKFEQPPDENPVYLNSDTNPWIEAEDIVDRQLMKKEKEMERDNFISILRVIADGRLMYDAEKRFEIREVIFNNPATIVYWIDGTKTVVTDMDNAADGKAKPAESYSKEEGLALCFMKKALGNKGSYNNAFRKWCPEEN